MFATAGVAAVLAVTDSRFDAAIVAALVAAIAAITGCGYAAIARRIFTEDRV